MATPALIPVDANRDNCVRIRRVTRENRQLFYQLTILQQPERARACGAGTKANSDRRPVDPPPVVELRIVEGSSFEEGKEITFDYNASFFLYASLEQHRKIAPGRMQGQPNPPILTGVPASGMAYLDRPTAAGYFIFPDLSVRHEGQYRLSFSLFETTKEEKDFDLDPTDTTLQPGVDWRMEIKTNPFDVYSAKKFPGLMESTQLSKEVADQGCRVRIRRDVRMRKREGKSNSAHDRREEEYARRRTVTPASDDHHSASARARSVSNSSEHRVAYPADRRPSGVDAYPPPPPPPPPPQSFDSASRGGHLSFGDHAAPQYAAPPPYQQPLTPVAPAGPYTPAAPYAKPEPQSYHPHPPSRGMLQHCPSPAPGHDGHDGHDRHPSGPYIPPSPSAYGPVDGHLRRESQHSLPPTPHSAPRPPHGSWSQLAPLRINELLQAGSRVEALPPIEPQTEPIPEVVPVPTGGKRKHNDVFQQHIQPLHNHKRPQDLLPSMSLGRLSVEDDRFGTYMRADGSVCRIAFPKFTNV